MMWARCTMTKKRCAETPQRLQMICTCVCDQISVHTISGGSEHDHFFSIYWEKSSQLTNIFERGLNHQPDMYASRYLSCVNLVHPHVSFTLRLYIRTCFRRDVYVVNCTRLLTSLWRKARGQSNKTCVHWTIKQMWSNITNKTHKTKSQINKEHNKTTKTYYIIILLLHSVLHLCFLFWLRSYGPTRVRAWHGLLMFIWCDIMLYVLIYGHNPAEY